MYSDRMDITQNKFYLGRRKSNASKFTRDHFFQYYQNDFISSLPPFPVESSRFNQPIFFLCDFCQTICLASETFSNQMLQR